MQQHFLSFWIPSHMIDSPNILGLRKRVEGIEKGYNQDNQLLAS